MKISPRRITKVGFVEDKENPFGIEFVKAQAAQPTLVGKVSAQPIVCQKDLAAARSHDVEKILPEEALYSGPCGGIGYQVVPGRARPELLQVRVSDEDWGSVRRV